MLLHSSRHPRRAVWQFSVDGRRPGRAAVGKVHAAASFLVAAAICLGALAGCEAIGPGDRADTFGMDFTMPDPNAQSGAIIFYVDGVNAQRFQRMLEANELPAFKKYFLDRGLYCPAAVCSIPSVTLANETSLVTGLFPGHHGVMGTRWFDRNQLIWRNYVKLSQKNLVDSDYQSPNIYEQFPDSSTFSLFFQLHRNATEFVENRIRGGASYGLGFYRLADRLAMAQMEMVAKTAQRRRQFPAVTIVYQLCTDFMAYHHGETSGQYTAAIKHADFQIGRVLGDIERAGLLDRLTLVMTSDHGMVDVGRHFILDDFLRKGVGLSLAREHLWEPTDFLDRMDYYDRFGAVTHGCGDRYWAIHLRRPIVTDGNIVGLEPWLVRPTAGDIVAYPVQKDGRTQNVNLPQALLSQPAVDTVAYRSGPATVRARRRGGEVEFRQEPAATAGISYRVVEGNDPLGYQGKVSEEILAGKAISSRQWLEATADTAYPDLAPQILAYFSHRHSGDVVVFAADDWDFWDENHGGHGGVEAQEMHVPLLLAGPNIPHARLAVARTIDVMPTILTLLGRPLPPNLDGVPLVELPKPEK